MAEVNLSHCAWGHNEACAPVFFRDFHSIFNSGCWLHSSISFPNKISPCSVPLSFSLYLSWAALPVLMSLLQFIKGLSELFCCPWNLWDHCFPISGKVCNFHFTLSTYNMHDIHKHTDVCLCETWKANFSYCIFIICVYICTFRCVIVLWTQRDASFVNQ